jgi:hypothetical protein
MSVVPLSGLLGPFAGEQFPCAEPATLRDHARVARFYDGSEELSELEALAEQRGLLCVRVVAPRAADRGKLALVVEEAIETALERRGACPPGIGAASDLDTSLGDQLYRARLVELRGLFVALGPLEGIAALTGALDVEDSAVLRFWLEAPRSRPVELALDRQNCAVAVYGPPVLLENLLAGESEPMREAVPDVAPAIAASARAMELSETPPPVGEIGGEPALAGDLAQALVNELVKLETPSVEAALVEALVAEPVSSEPPAVAPAEPLETPEPVAEASAESAALETPAAEPSAESAAEPVPESAALETPAAEPAPLAAHDAETLPEPIAAAEEVSAELPQPIDPGARDSWPRWLEELGRARGPKPLAAVERMFVQSYVPLRDAYLRGIAPAEVGAALEGWAASFAKSYTDAFEALRVRGKRPSMVLDVPDAALRIGRLHGARSVQLLLVDGMRFDLGLRAERILRARLGGEVALTERLLVWSALPSDTNTQLALLGRGTEGLRELGQPAPHEIPVARGRMAKTARRIKVGHRELLKLDLVEARLSELGPPEAARLDELAVELADAIAELCEKLPTRTLLVAFGDHGFVLDPHGRGTGPARHGGARPEEVLVPAFAWLVGGVQ